MKRNGAIITFQVRGQVQSICEEEEEEEEEEGEEEEGGRGGVGENE